MKCINCGHFGHSYKVCREPKTSYGILAIRIDILNRENEQIVDSSKTNQYNEIKGIITKYLHNQVEITDKQHITCNNETSLKKFTDLKRVIKLLLIMRKHTLGYMEFIRGHYSINNITQLAYLFEQMTPYEIKTICENYNNFDFLWKNMWSSEYISTEHYIKLEAIDSLKQTTNNDKKDISVQQLNYESPQSNESNESNESDESDESDESQKNILDKPKKCDVQKSCIKSSSKRHYDSHIEFDNSKHNFMKLQNETVLKLSDIIRNIKPLYNCPEWGIPKGRRAGNESDLECAKREFTEETGYTSDDYELFDNINPLVENIIGSNGVKYRHVYYIAILKSDKPPSCQNLKKAQLCEIGDIGLFDLDESLQKIRPHHTDRQRIIYSVCINIVKSIMCYSERHI